MADSCVCARVLRLKNELDDWARRCPDRLTLVHVLGNKPEDKAPAGWVNTDTYYAATGWIDERKVEKNAFKASEDTLVLVSGVDAMVTALCGPREEAHLKQGSVLDNLGYTTGMITKL